MSELPIAPLTLELWPDFEVGDAGVFRRAGFREAAGRKANRPLLRLRLDKKAQR